MLVCFVTSTLQFASPPSVLPDPSFSPCATPRPYVSTSFSITSTLLPRSFALFGLHQNSSAFFSTTCALFAKNNLGVPPLLPFRNAQAVPVSLTKIHALRTIGSLLFFRRLLLLLGLFCTVLPPNTAAQAPKDNLAQAESLIHQGKFDESIALLNPLLKTDPQNVQARNSLGIALSQKGELSAANREFLAILKLNPKFSPALQNLAANEYTLKDFAASEKHFLAAAKILPDDPAVNSFLGKLTFKRGAYADAAKYLPKAAPLFQQEPALVVALVQSELEIGQDAAALSYLPQFNAASASLRAQFQLAVALSNRDHFEQAIPFFEAVQKQYPDSYDAAFNLAVCYVQTKAFSKAVELLSRLKEKGHKTAELDNLLAESYSGTGNLQAEIDSLREATQLEPEDENNYLDLAALCLDHDGFDLALEVLDVGLHYKPDSDRLIFQRGLAHAMKNEFDLAERDFQSASQLAPEKNLSYVGLGVSYMQTGNLPEAVRTLRARAKEKPSDATLQYLLGEALLRSGASPASSEFVEARAAFAASTKLNPKFVPPLVELAKMNLKENSVEEAVALLERARSLDPSDNAACSQLAVAYRRQGKLDQAKEAFAALAKLNEEQRLQATRGRVRLAKQSPGATTPTQDQNP